MNSETKELQEQLNEIGVGISTQSEAIHEAALTKIVTDSGLQLNEAETIKQSYLPYFNQIAEIKEQAKKIDFENPKEIDEKIARDLRLKTVKVRTGSELVKDERKKIHSLKANVEQSAWNLIKTTCQLDEELFLQVEKKREVAEKKRKDELKAARIVELQPYSEFVSFDFIDLGSMNEIAYSQLLTGAKLQQQAKIDADKKAEDERIAKEKADQEERQKQKEENDRLKKKAEEFKKKFDEEKKAANLKAKEERDAIEAKAKKEREETARKNKIESDRIAEEHLKEKKKNDEILRKQKEANDKLAADLKAKEEKEAKAKKERDDALKAQQLADKKAKAAPDKVKLVALATTIENIVLPELKSDEAKELLKSIEVLLNKTSVFIRKKTELL